MKILRIIARLNVGGPARHVVWLTRGLADDGFETRLVAGTVPEGEGDMSYFAAENGVEPVFIAEMSRELSVRDAISVWKIFRQMRAFAPDIIHTHTAKAGTAGRVAAFAYRWLTWGTLTGRPRNVKVLHTFHGHVFHSYYGRLKTRLFIVIEKLLALIATDRIIVITRQQLEEINGTFGIGRRRQFEVIPLGIDLGSFEESGPMREAFRGRAGAGSGEILVVFSGRLTEIKGLSLFLGAARKANIAYPNGGPRLRFAIVGDGHLRGRLEAEAAELGVADAVRFLGSVENIAAAYAGADIVALTSLNEGTPLSLIEAMAAGRPIVSTMVGGVVDLLGNIVSEEEGFVICERGVGIPGRSAEDLLKGLLYLAKDGKLRGRLGDKGKAFVDENYSKERLIDDIRELYQDLAGKSSA
jgi:glycosyltransferase involved in cell wall biosynthesis